MLVIQQNDVKYKNNNSINKNNKNNYNIFNITLKLTHVHNIKMKMFSKFSPSLRRGYQLRCEGGGLISLPKSRKRGHNR